MSKKLDKLVAKYLLWHGKKDRAEKKLKSLKKQLVTLAKKERIKKIETETTKLYFVTQLETRFPQFDEKNREEVERIVKESGELDKVMTFDVIKLGNLYDEEKLSKELMKKLKPYAKRVRLTKIRLKELNP